MIICHPYYSLDAIMVHLLGAGETTAQQGSVVGSGSWDVTPSGLTPGGCSLHTNSALHIPTLQAQAAGFISDSGQDSVLKVSIYLSIYLPPLFLSLFLLSPSLSYVYALYTYVYVDIFMCVATACAHVCISQSLKSGVFKNGVSY